MSRIRPLSIVTIATAVAQVAIIFSLDIAIATKLLPLLPLFTLLLQYFLNRVTLLKQSVRSCHSSAHSSPMPPQLTNHALAALYQEPDMEE